MPDLKTRLSTWARSLKAELTALNSAARDPRTPWYAKGLAIVVIAYALSPIDLIPDVIPVIGLVDDLILVPLGIALVLRFIPPEVIAEHRAKAIEAAHVQPSKLGLFIVIAIWLATLILIAAVVRRRWL